MSSVSPSISSSVGPFRLSASLSHECGVRDAALVSLASGGGLGLGLAVLEERGAVCQYQLATNNQWTLVAGEHARAQMHQGLAFVIEAVQGCSLSSSVSSSSSLPCYPASTVMSGGADRAARPFTLSGSVFPPLLGHGNSVNSISHVSPSLDVVTGSWDGMVRLWRGATCIATIPGHEHAVEVLGLDDDLIVTGSANKAIHFIQHSKIIKKINNAHDHAIRKLVRHPLGFASIGNDGVLKVWSADGQQLLTIDVCSTSEIKFLYGLTLVNAHAQSIEQLQYVTGGEDGYVRIFDSTGKLQQAIAHPGPVRCVKSLPNGDILSGCSDKLVRFFTVSAERLADAATLQQFDEMQHLLKTSDMRALDPDTLEDESALSVPGNKNGQVKVLRVHGRGAIAYQWSEDTQEWVEIGEALGSSGKSTKKMKLDGQEYDYVTDIYVSDEHKIPLGFNRDDDPAEVTDRFCTVHQIPDYLRQQIFEFVAPKTDAVAISERKQRQAAQQAAQIKFMQIPSWNSSLEMYANANLQAMEKKMNEIQASHVAASPNARPTADEFKHAFPSLVNTLRDPTMFHSSDFPPAAAQLLHSLVHHWSTADMLPVLDCVRVLMLHSNANTTISNDTQLLSKLLQHANAGDKDTYKILMMKIASNWIAKRSKSPEERRAPPSIPPGVEQLLLDVLSFCEQLQLNTIDNDNMLLAYVMLTHNVICWYGRLRIASSAVYARIVDTLLAVLSAKQRGEKIAFYAALTIGSILFTSKQCRQQYKDSSSLLSVVSGAAASSNRALQEVAADIQNVFRM